MLENSIQQAKREGKESVKRIKKAQKRFKTILKRLTNTADVNINLNQTIKKENK